MRLFLGNIRYDTTAADVAELLERYGTATHIEVPVNHETGTGQGIAFADLPDPAALRAIAELAGTDFGGRRLMISEARPKQRDRRPWSEHLAARGGRRDDMRTL